MAHGVLILQKVPLGVTPGGNQAYQVNLVGGSPNAVYPTAVGLQFNGPLVQEWTVLSPPNDATPDETFITLLTNGGADDSHFLVATTTGPPIFAPAPNDKGEDKAPPGAGPGIGTFLFANYAISGGWNAHVLPVAYIVLPAGQLATVTGSASYNTQYPPEGNPIEEPISSVIPEPATLVLLSLGGLLLRRRS
jgi:hypothetical protein